MPRLATQLPAAGGGVSDLRVCVRMLCPVLAGICGARWGMCVEVCADVMLSMS